VVPCCANSGVAKSRIIKVPTSLRSMCAVLQTALMFDALDRRIASNGSAVPLMTPNSFNY
jgi:hypothetical protein